MARSGFFKRLKIRPTDFIFLVPMCIALYFVYKYEFKQISQKVSKQRQEEQIRSFETLQINCIKGDIIACDKLNQNFIKQKGL